MRILCIVEGHGEVAAVPILLRRLALEISVNRPVEVPRPIRIPRSKLLSPGELERAVELAGRQTQEGDAIFVIVDADEDCPAQLGPSLLGRVRRARPDRKTFVVLAKCEFEAWFLAAAASLAGQRSLAAHLAPPDNPEEIRDAKGWLTRHSTEGASYRETLDQPALAAIVDLTQARSSRSFDKLRRDLLVAVSE